MLRILAIDPGTTGAWATMNSFGDLVDCGDLPIVGDGARKTLSPTLLADIIAQQVPTFALIERVGARTGEAASGAFKFGRSCGIIEGVLGACRVRTGFVASQVWKKHHGLFSTDKEASRQLALQMFPAQSQFFARKKDHGRSEAALIALWGFRACGAAGEVEAVREAAE